MYAPVAWRPEVIDLRVLAWGMIAIVSHTYPVPGSDREYQAPRSPGLHLRVVPNESLASLWPHLGDLVQAVIDATSDQSVSVELDTSDRTLPGEQRGGASPLASIALVLLDATSGAVVDELLHVAVAWVRRHLPSHGPSDLGTIVTVYGTDGEVLSRVNVQRDPEDLGRDKKRDGQQKRG